MYHSTLVKFGPAVVTITSDVIPSKPQYAKGYGKFCGIEHEGTEQTLNIENEACEKALAGYKGQQVTLEASGARDTASLKVSGGVPAPVTTAQARKSFTPTTPEKAARQWSMSALLALRMATRVKEQYEKEFSTTMTPEQLQGLVTNCNIFFQNTGVTSSMDVEDEIPF